MDKIKEDTGNLHSKDEMIAARLIFSFSWVVGSVLPDKFSISSTVPPRMRRLSDERVEWCSLLDIPGEIGLGINGFWYGTSDDEWHNTDPFILAYLSSSYPYLHYLLHSSTSNRH